jgi:hypothetical protein
MSHQVEFLLFGDQSHSTHEALVDLYTRGHRGTLSASFLEKASAALRREIDNLPGVQRRRLPKFSTIKELNERYHVDGRKDCAVDGALLCISQLAHYIE